MDGGQGNDRLTGGQGNDLMSGSRGADILLGCKGEDALYGGAGDDVIRDFQGGLDLIKINADDMRDLRFTQDGSDAIIGHGNGDTITLVGKDIGDLQASDFIFF